jgi:hypothetical protein
VNSLHNDVDYIKPRCRIAIEKREIRHRPAGHLSGRLPVIMLAIDGKSPVLPHVILLPDAS